MLRNIGTAALLVIGMLTSEARAVVVVTVGSQVEAKVSATSQATGCHTNCWEVLTIKGVGRILVTKGTDGRIVSSVGVVYEQYLDLRSMMDEVDRGILKQNPVVYFGTVSATTRSPEPCSIRCGFGIDFGQFHLWIERNELGTLFAGGHSAAPVTYSDDDFGPPPPSYTVPITDPSHVHQGVPRCAQGLAASERTNCFVQGVTIYHPDTGHPTPTYVQYGNEPGRATSIYCANWDSLTGDWLRVYLPAFPPAPFIVDKP